MAVQLTLLDGDTGGKRSSLELLAGEALTARALDPPLPPGVNFIQLLGASGNIAEVSPGQLASVDIEWVVAGGLLRWVVASWANALLEPPLANLAIVDAFSLDATHVRVRFTAYADPVLAATVFVNLLAIPD